MSSGDVDDYAKLLGDVKARVARAQVQAALAASRELLRMYWDVGQMIHAQQGLEGWGTKVIPRLARDLAHEVPGARGFSERNLERMLRFFRAYPNLGDVGSVGDGKPAIPPQAVSELEVGSIPAQAVAESLDAVLAHLALGLPWGHNVLLLQKLPDPKTRLWYMQRSAVEGWNRDVLASMIKNGAHLRQGAAITNFGAVLPAPQSALAQETIKDPYVFDFLALDTGFRERELELGLLQHLERFLLELGVGFAFVGRQVPLRLEDDEFFLDLLFYHLELRCYVVVDLKIGPFKAEHAGKMNLYLNLVDDQKRRPGDAPSIGLILCQDKKRVLAEYALRGVERPIGVSEYEITRALPTELASSLPTVDSIEAELSEEE